MEDRIASLPRSDYQFTNDATVDELQIAVENAMTGISWLDTEGKFRIVRKGYAQMLGYAPDELLGQSWEVTVVPADRPAGAGALGTMLREGQVSVESRGMRKDGSIFNKKLLLVKTTDTQGNHSGHYCFMSDITEQKETQRRFEESERLRTVGTLAGGIAHDLNNLLAPILGFSDLMARQPEQVVVAVETIREASLQAQRLTQRLLDFSRPRERGPGYVCLSGIVDLAVRWVAGSMPANVRTEVSLDASCSVVQGEEARLEAMVMNLLSNAGDAMGNSGGTIRVHMCNPRPGELELSVSDDGPGIPEDILRRVFEPFFTTKPSDKGYGLGLYMVRNTVESMGGTIDVESKEGEGTCFRLKLHCTDSVPEEASVGVGEKAPSRALRILVVDDQQAMLSVCEAMLTHLGHSCELVTRLEDALEQAAAGFDLVLTDYRIGGESGLSLVKALEGIGVPVILMSGHFDSVETLPEGILACLEKPFDIDALENALQGIAPDSISND